ncbi:MAG: ATP-binding cassette domain-containing protein, partial [Pseudomonadota bacterium]|nr:ATP-binding cassette domain-containing protein [Pseudomonadota bacterium]
MSGEPARALARLEDIGKSFGPVTALSDVSFALHPGEIHALLGENGAGKSTLMNILFGMQTADQGRILINGADVTRAWTTKKAIACGVGMIHQHFSLVCEHTVLENVVMPTLSWRELRVDWKSHHARLVPICAEFGITFDPDAPVERLTMG